MSEIPLSTKFSLSFFRNVHIRLCTRSTALLFQCIDSHRFQRTKARRHNILDTLPSAENDLNYFWSNIKDIIRKIFRKRQRRASYTHLNGMLKVSKTVKCRVTPMITENRPVVPVKTKIVSSVILLSLWDREDGHWQTRHCGAYISSSSDRKCLPSPVNLWNILQSKGHSFPLFIYSFSGFIFFN